MIIPKDAAKLGIIIEFKKIDEFLKTNIDEGTEVALKQIEEMKYEQELVQRGVGNYKRRFPEELVLLWGLDEELIDEFDEKVGILK